MLLPLIIALSHALGLASAVHSVMNTRTAQGSIAWAASLIAVPYVAVPAYWILGRSRFEGYVSARRLGAKRLREVIPEAFNAEIREEFVASSDALGDAATLGLTALSNLCELPWTRRNEVELLVDGEATFDSILAGIDRAEDYVLVQFYTVRDDDIGRELKGRLLARLEAGVRVLFLYDEIGSYALADSYCDELREAGAQACAFGSTFGRSYRFQLNFRNHRKIVVVDGREGWIGGHNVGDEYLGRDPAFGPWRDTHVRIAGPSVLQLQLTFAEDWNWATGEALEKLRWQPEPSKEGDQKVLIIPSSPADERETATLTFLQAITGAKERIWIATPYFVPDPDLLGALTLADLRGVDVRVLIPEKPDHQLVHLAAYTFVEELETTGIEFYRYQAGFLHQKVLLVDGATAAVSTANFDNRSMRLNFEVTAVVVDEGFAAQIEKMLQADFGRAEHFPADALRHRRWWFRFLARLARLTAPIL